MTDEVFDRSLSLYGNALAFQPLRRLGSLAGTWQIAAASLERIYQVLDLRPSITSGTRR